MLRQNHLMLPGEMVRVTCPGGRIVMGNWIPGDQHWLHRFWKSVQPTHHRHLKDLLAQCQGWRVMLPNDLVRPVYRQIEFALKHETFTFQAAISPVEFVQQFKLYYFWPNHECIWGCRKEWKGWKICSALFASQNKSGSTTSVSIPATFLKVTVMV